jgi:hypothetical protein|tara:strand:- start:575 stop:874 length:300 start_codon:yes stop_codon:yes gene_type:complete
MKLSELAQEPKLIKLIVDHESVKEKYGEELEFWVYDRQPINTFAKMASADPKENFDEIAEVMSDLILDENGNKVLADGKILPMDLMTHCITKVSETLGK